MTVFVFRELKIKIIIGFKHFISLGSKPFEKRLNFYIQTLLQKWKTCTFRY
jgi:hypothetical protein